jgi:hypothetical protein
MLHSSVWSKIADEILAAWLKERDEWPKQDEQRVKRLWHLGHETHERWNKAYKQERGLKYVQPRRME